MAPNTRSVIGIIPNSSEGGTSDSNLVDDNVRQLLGELMDERMSRLERALEGLSSQVAGLASRGVDVLCNDEPYQLLNDDLKSCGRYSRLRRLKMSSAGCGVQESSKFYIGSLRWYQSQSANDLGSTRFIADCEGLNIKDVVFKIIDAIGRWVLVLLGTERYVISKISWLLESTELEIQEMVNILVSGEAYDKVFNHLHAPLEGKKIRFEDVHVLKVKIATMDHLGIRLLFALSS
ncbi:hypothetical protein Tco_0859350 [Tanacetum coccineum]|uniref:Uncharacterized protein n=1 Tax=Tanacetum coccineum TaxID=301880 RepID=A0ABQ5BCR3_9ASTR